MDAELAGEIEAAFLAVDDQDPVGKAVLDGEACRSFVAMSKLLTPFMASREA